MTDHAVLSRQRRIDAAEIAFDRLTVTHHANGDEQRVRDADGAPTYVGSFTKCLPHDEHGFLLSPTDFSEWVQTIDSGDPRDVQAVRIGPGPFRPNGDLAYDGAGTLELDWSATYAAPEKAPAVRAWESRGAGLTLDLQGRTQRRSRCRRARRWTARS